MANTITINLTFTLNGSANSSLFYGTVYYRYHDQGYGKDVSGAIYSNSADKTIVAYRTMEVSLSAALPAGGYSTFDKFDGSSSSSLIVTSDGTHTANFNGTYHSSDFYNGGDSAEYYEGYRQTQNGLTYPQPITVSKTNFLFNGWYNSNLSRQYPTGQLVWTNEEYEKWYAHWKYRLTYNANGGTDQGVSYQEAAATQPIVLKSETPTKDDYDFLYWTTTQNGTGARYYPGGTQYDWANTGNVTLYAQWESNTPSPTPTTDYVKVYNNGQWVEASVIKRYNGSSWEDFSIKKYDGNEWK